METNRVIKSPFQFKSYKIDTVNLNVRRDIGVLEGSTLANDSWDFKLRIRHPQFFKAKNCYIGGLDVLTNLYEQGKDSIEEFLMVQLEAGIAGVFYVNGTLEKSTEDILVRVQIPAILLPYLRSTVSALLSSAGFGSVIFPLINIHALAEENRDKIQIQIIE